MIPRTYLIFFYTLYFSLESYTLGVLTFVYIRFGFFFFWKKGIGVLDMGQCAPREYHEFIQGWIVSFGLLFWLGYLVFVFFVSVWILLSHSLVFLCSIYFLGLT